MSKTYAKQVWKCNETAQIFCQSVLGTCRFHAAHMTRANPKLFACMPEHVWKMTNICPEYIEDGNVPIEYIDNTCPIRAIEMKHMRELFCSGEFGI